LFAICLAGLALRLYRLPLLVLWSDEFHTVRIIRLPLETILSGRYGELNPPLYFALLKGFAALTGETEWNLRFFSLIFSIISLPVLYLLAREILPSKISSLAAVLLMALHPIFINYSVEIRCYSLLLFFNLVSFLAYARMLATTRMTALWGALMAGSLAAGLATHHFGSLALLAILAHLAAQAFVNPRWDRREWIILALTGIALLLSIPSLAVLYQQAQTYTTNKAAMIPPDQFLQVFTFSFQQPAYEPLVGWVAGLALGAGLFRILRRGRQNPSGLLVVCGLLTSTLALLLANLAGVNIIQRYLIGIIPLALIGIAAAIDYGPKWQNRGLIGIVGIAAALYLGYGIDFTVNTPAEVNKVFWKSDWKAVAQTIKSLREPGEAVVKTAWDITPVQYYLEETTLALSEIKNQQADGSKRCFLLVVSPNTLPDPIYEQASLVYQDPQKAIRLLRWCKDP
jgi:hypothetical protein